ncbi:MAG: hypothetical protein ACOYXM_10830 [Actinomycetota bacterium]
MTADPTPSADLHAVRRADWRFLLPDPEVRRVVLAGSGVAALHRAGLEADGVEVVELAGYHGLPDHADAIVCSAEPHLAAALLRDRPRIPLYVELGARAAFDRRWRALLRDRDGAHFLVVPDHDRRRAYAPLDDRRSLRWLGAGRQGPAGRLARSGLADLQLVRAAARRVAPSRAVVLSQDRSQHSLAAWLASSALLDEDGPEDETAPTSHLILTPRFATSQHVVLLAGRRKPEIVVKTSRLSGDGVDGEVSALRQLWAAAGGRDVGAPRLLRHEVWGRRTIFAETAVRGEPVSARSAAADPSGTATDVTTWLIGLPREAVASTPARLAALLTPALDAVAAMGESHEEELVRATRLATAELARWELPVVFEHGDVSAPNIFRTSTGIALIDWELARPVGLPGHDLFVALGFVARSVSSEVGGAALERAFLHSPPAWLRGELGRYARQLGLPAQALPALFLCCWARVSASLAARAAADHGNLDWWRGQPATRLWTAAARQPERLSWME